MVKDICPGALNGNPFELHDGGGFLLFTARDETHALELWRSDGTYTSTVMLADIYQSPLASAIQEITALGNLAFFRANDGVTAHEPWVSDGTAAGTFLLSDVYSGPMTSNPSGFAPAGSQVLFAAQEDIYGIELWASDGTTSGTTLVKDIFPGPGWSSPEELVSLGDRVVFRAADLEHGYEPWVSDGTPAGTLMLADILSGTGYSYPRDLLRYGDQVYFEVDDGVGPQLWVTGGTPGTTLPVVSLPGWMEGFYAVEGNGMFFFVPPPGLLSAEPPGEGDPDGAAGVDGGSPDWDDETTPMDLWHSDGSAAGTAYVATLPGYPALAILMDVKLPPQGTCCTSPFSPIPPATSCGAAMAHTPAPSWCKTLSPARAAPGLQS
jgi:ELWxxDGT repeat protein